MFRRFSIAMFRIMGWSVRSDMPPDLDKYIIVVAPHTSNLDFFIGLFARSIMRMNDVRYLAKKELFRWPLGSFFRALGGYPVDRSKKTNLVDQVAELFRTMPGFKIAITPEGTRTHVDRWRTGFYRIAQQADVPIVLAAMDYGRKEVAFSDVFPMTGDQDADIARMMAHFRGVRGRHPDKGVT
ncbi:MAG: 1-acyl-sn-glycerol-3-phosphate acyltransferase [Flavobacteriales bacterium]|nr:1-acyl-sn-glycerol-3-phosphate acyltransferase [Flavobacteriales bacterium]MCB9168178.1 1-acyl-sn-glycerol-3-phosphate acyltransferase [Flavobacteriales bacterium]MCB9194257.1 1-acyl-sn-glycerol-3-phosphate acyltransferase [Flavobacteriales bacterium]